MKTLKRVGVKISLAFGISREMRNLINTQKNRGLFVIHCFSCSLFFLPPPPNQ